MLAAIAKPVNALNAIVLILDLTSVRLAKFFFISVTNFKPKTIQNSYKHLQIVNSCELEIQVFY